MILFSSKKIEDCLVSGKLDSYQKYKYLALTFFLFTISGPIFIVTPKFEIEPSVIRPLLSFISWIVYVFVLINGIKKCYRTNKKIDDNFFVERFILLHLPLIMKFIAILLTSSLALYYLIVLVTGKNEFPTIYFPFFISIFVPATTYVFYVLLDRSFKRLSVKLKDNKLENS